MKPVLWTLLTIFIVLVLAGLLITYTGVYNVAALTPEGGLVDWFAGTTMDHSVRAHSSGVVVPDYLRDSSLIDVGFAHYREMCIDCHGSPAGGMSEAGMGLNPKAPELSEAAKDWTPAELYWIVKNGVKMTGMPAFAPTHKERELWAMVAFLERLKAMTPKQYKAFAAARAKSEEDHDTDENAQSRHNQKMND